MKLHRALTLVACLLLASEAVSAEKDALQGTWVVESCEAMGLKIDALNAATFTFSGGTFKIKAAKGDKEPVGNYSIQAGKSPRQIDMTNKAPGGKDMTTLAIYKIEGDTLMICAGSTTSSTNVRPDGTESETVVKQDPRPTAFESKQGVLMVLKRKK